VKGLHINKNAGTKTDGLARKRREADAKRDILSRYKDKWYTGNQGRDLKLSTNELIGNQLKGKNGGRRKDWEPPTKAPNHLERKTQDNGGWKQKGIRAPLRGSQQVPWK